MTLSACVTEAKTQSGSASVISLRSRFVEQKHHFDQAQNEAMACVSNPEVWSQHVQPFAMRDLDSCDASVTAQQLFLIYNVVASKG